MRSLLFATFLLLGGCAVGPGPDRFNAAKESEATGAPRPFEAPEGAWKNPTWDLVLHGEIIQQRLHEVATLTDAERYCPKYERLTTDQRLHFWHTFFVAVAKRESSYRESTAYEEDFDDSAGKNVISRGVFQLSQESANQKAYDCKITDAKMLHQARINIQCAVKVEAFWVRKHNYAGMTVDGEHKGGAKYWSVLRGWDTSPKYIASQTLALSFCK